MTAAGKKIPINHRPEMAGGIIGVLIAALLPQLGLSKDTAWLIGIMVALASLTTAYLKSAFASHVHDVLDGGTLGLREASRLMATLPEIDGELAAYAFDAIRDATSSVESIREGCVPLKEDDFFDHIISASDSLGRGDRIYAINAFEERRWLEDPREMNFFRSNKKAISKGVTIDRIFILSRVHGAQASRLDCTSEAAQVIAAQLGIGVQTSVVFRDELTGKDDLLQDSILFDGTPIRLYRDYQDRADRTRISHGEMYTREVDHIAFRGRYRKLTEHAITKTELEEMLRRHTTTQA